MFEQFQAFYCNCKGNKPKILFKVSQDQKTIIINCGHHKPYQEYVLKIIGDGRFVLPNEK